MPRNPRSAWRGIGGRHAAELTADIGRNTKIVSWIDALWGSPADELSMIMAGRAPYMVGLFTILLLSVWGAWTGTRQARWLFVLILTTVIAVSLKDLFSVPALVEGRDQAAEQWWSAFRYSAMIGTAMLVWLALVSWYFFSERTRYFFATRCIQRQEDGKGPVSPH